jgi:hypothetical protein
MAGQTALSTSLKCNYSIPRNLARDVQRRTHGAPPAHRCRHSAHGPPPTRRRIYIDARQLGSAIELIAYSLARETQRQTLSDLKPYAPTCAIVGRTIVGHVGAWLKTTSRRPSCALPADDRVSAAARCPAFSNAVRSSVMRAAHLTCKGPRRRSARIAADPHPPAKFMHRVRALDRPASTRRKNVQQR